MAFGRIMRVATTKGLQLELAPLAREDMPDYVKDGGLQLHSVTRYLNAQPAPTLQDEQEWFDRTRKAADTVAWGIYALDDDVRTLVGGTTLFSIEQGVIRQATSGIVIFRPDYWGQGVASAAHLARTLYAFEQLGLHRIRSAVIDGNAASLRALQRVGYEPVYVERNSVFVDGRLHHQTNLELLNPSEPFWSVWWGSDKPTEAALATRQRTLTALDEARRRVTLP